MVEKHNNVYTMVEHCRAVLAVPHFVVAVCAAVSVNASAFAV